MPVLILKAPHIQYTLTIFQFTSIFLMDITYDINTFRALEDFVTWVDSSKVRQHVMEYQDLRDDYDVNC